MPENQNPYDPPKASSTGRGRPFVFWLCLLGSMAGGIAILVLRSFLDLGHSDLLNYIPPPALLFAIGAFGGGIASLAAPQAKPDKPNRFAEACIIIMLLSVLWSLLLPVLHSAR